MIFCVIGDLPLDLPAYTPPQVLQPAARPQPAHRVQPAPRTQFSTPRLFSKLQKGMLVVHDDGDHLLIGIGGCVNWNRPAGNDVNVVHKNT